MSAKKAEQPTSSIIPVRELIATQMDRLQLSPAWVAAEVGYSSANIISMLKRGSMRLPLNKLSAMARALQIDPLYLARSMDNDDNLGLTELLDAVSKRTAVTANEEQLILKLREVTQGIDPNYYDYPDLFEELVERAQALAGKAATDHAGAISRIARSRIGSALSKEKPQKKKPDDTDAVES